MANVMSPIVAERIWALPLSASAVKFLQYLVFRSEFGGALPVRQKDMAVEYGVTPQAVSILMTPLCELNLVLRPRSEERNGNSYRLHPLAAKYETPEVMDEAFRAALDRIRAGDLPSLRLPAYQQAPPAPTGRRPKLQIA
ncbi:hypothetical protein LG634_12455 [Streptomyces bambusae]|uniref:hypothetical protein n=1 Tax=Streptomyces bambusae TaxID=1550616 RepID=UPI001CFD75D4|nr:hypothetical protein [Streptomyces bambusae]MCB5165642.1 hypothetical protein [Streptomyces bambusae]